MNCKPGDLAIVVKCGKGLEECIGRFVSVIRLLEGCDWEVEFVGPVPAIAASEAKKQRCKGFWISDRCLRPISGIPVGEDLRDEIKELA